MSDSARHAIDRADRQRERNNAAGRASGGAGAFSGVQSSYGSGYDSDAGRHRLDQQDRGYNGKGKQTEGGSNPSKLGGTTVVPLDQPKPFGAVPVTDANPLIAGPKAALIGPMGMAGNVVAGALGIGDTEIGKKLGIGDLDPYGGKQLGWQPDRFKGKANLTGIGDPGSASGVSRDEREIVGRPLRAVPNEVGDASETVPGSGISPDAYSDVPLADRRKPYTSLKQMLETML